ncbi:hypothetical protein E4U13_007547 [Claviceps humidiphila]|uniref:Uncharacterized protein n=1 Tax=Claviceps humidiphila TaxID=1294629 RepID=A0A9P7PWF6_9HYPO|nr:hypothetical protein E4U13_007547 [Claviceps humidiphila]
MPAPDNHPQTIDSFYGSGDVRSWLKKLPLSCRRVNGNQVVSLSDLIQVMDRALTGDAAMFVEKNALLGQIVDQADDLTATVENLVLFESTLQDHFDIKAVVEVARLAHDGLFRNVVQGDGESLDAYHGRFLSIYLGRGGSDKPVTLGSTWPTSAYTIGSLERQ